MNISIKLVILNENRLFKDFYLFKVGQCLNGMLEVSIFYMIVFVLTYLVEIEKFLYSDTFCPCHPFPLHHQTN